ncbi:Homeodomain-interacting protein kinase 1 [Liparis tanakae]|uniref:Homeodomain-interacting protein kinase 1 n=1 Tax=Liparis tanakae TaxID=230148 RepID=A0A4Z2H5R5_9TELE|nr:Homeodomain-interacting protein kinase 1 [Liparis tanakae]
MHRKEPYRLKVIDFGLALEVSAATQGAYIQTLLYSSSRAQRLLTQFLESNDKLLFGDILCGMLEIDAAKRLTPRQVLQHQFTSMHHISSRYHVRPYVRSYFETMDLCGKAVVGSSGGAYSVQQNFPSASALSQPQAINPHPCSTTRTSGSLNSGQQQLRITKRQKKKMADCDDADDQQLTDHKIKRSAACPANCSPRSVLALPAVASVSHECSGNGPMTFWFQQVRRLSFLAFNPFSLIKRSSLASGTRRADLRQRD